MAFNHPWKQIHMGLFSLGEVSKRDQRDECEILIDSYAAEAINELASYEIRQELQGWARSYYTLSGHMESILRYNRPKIPSPSDPLWNTTLQSVLQFVRQWPKCRSKSYQNFDSVRWLRSSAAGYGYTGLKGDFDNYKRARKVAYTICEKIRRSDADFVNSLQNSTPDVAFTRTQLSQIKIKRKVRNVWGEAFHYVLLEGLFADNLIEYFMFMDSFYYIGNDPLIDVPTRVTKMMTEYDYVYQFDWSAFDASVQEWEIRSAFFVLEQILSFDSPVEARIWEFVVELFIYRKIACPDGSLQLKTLGIPSGSCFTNMIGSIVNYHRVQYLFLKHTSDYSCAYTHGDDSLCGVLRQQAIHPNAFVPTCEAYLWELNPEKTRVSNTPEDIEFLSRSVRDGVNYRNSMICLRMLLYPEYPVTDGTISTLRAYSILYDSGLESELLFKIYLYLKFKFGTAKELPLHFTKWNALLFEQLRLPYLN